LTENAAISAAVGDLKNGWARNRLWMTLARDDIRLRYKRSILGPLWITLGTGFFIMVLGVLWSEIMGREAAVFIPWVATGLTSWQLIAAIVVEGTTTFTVMTGIIHNIPMPLSVHVYRSIVRHFINYSHNFLVVVFVLILFPPPLSFKTLMFIPGMLILATTAMSCATILGTLGARYRDFSFSVRTLMGPMFFLTPIVWIPDMLTGTRAQLAELNPFSHFIAVIRDPLLGRELRLIDYGFTIGIMLLMVYIALRLLGEHKTKIPYWIA